MKVLGLTGPIGSGKSFVAAIFRELGAAVFDADLEVHRLYAEDKKVIAAVAEKFPHATKNHLVDRAVLAQMALHDESAMRDLEAIIHPAVRQAEKAFLTRQKKRGAELAVLDIPLLFQTGADALCDVVLLLAAPEEVRKARVLSRPGMSQEKWQKIVARQGAEAYKPERADFVLNTHQNKAILKDEVQRVIKEVLA